VGIDAIKAILGYRAAHQFQPQRFLVGQRSDMIGKLRIGFPE
jgi:hypothetical protein